MSQGLITAMSWAGTALQLIGAFALGERLVRPTWAYSVMLPGAMLWLAVSVLTRHGAMVVLMAAYCLINIRGLSRWRL